MSDLSKMRDDGLYEVVEYKTNKKGERIKVVTLRKRFTVTVRKYESANIRKTGWSKFGEAAKPGNDKITYVSTEEVFMEPPSPKKKKEEEKKEDSYDVKCRHCEGKHWTRKCPTLEENKVEPVVVVDEVTKREKVYNKEEEKKQIEKKVVEKTTKTLRIEQLTREAQEIDIYERFSTVGQVHSIWIPKDYNSGESRGFAFAEVRNEEDAKRIIAKYDNFGLDHLRLKITML